MKKLAEVNLATIDPAAAALAERYDLGLEVDEFCTAMNMDDPEYFPQLHSQVLAYGTRARIFHAPYNELYPCAIDPKFRALALQRLEQTYELAQQFGIHRMVCHGNYLPNVYFPVWYVEKSISFWKDFLRSKPADFQLYIENVLEPEPEYLRDIVLGIDDPRCRLCLDIGHAHVACVSDIPVMRWLEVCAPVLGHVHLHNNDRSWDWHRTLNEGGIEMTSLLEYLTAAAPAASVTLEHPQNSEQSLLWLAENAWI